MQCVAATPPPPPPPDVEHVTTLADLYLSSLSGSVFAPGDSAWNTISMLIYSTVGSAAPNELRRLNVLIPFYDYDGEGGAYRDYTNYAEFAPAVGDNYPADCGSLGQIPFDYTLHRDTQGRPYIALIMPCFFSAEGRNIAFMLRFKNAVGSVCIVWRL